MGPGAKDIEEALNNGVDGHDKARCPRCGQTGLWSVEQKFQASPTGTYSLAGHQMKLSAKSYLIASCDQCDLEMRIEHAAFLDEAN